MNVTYQLLASAHEADLLREAHDRRLKDDLCTCGRRLLGILPIREPCDDRSTP